MKQLLFLFSLALSACQYSEPASNLVMCHGAVSDFALFASDREFQEMHPAPLPMELYARGKFVEFPVDGGSNGRAYCVKPSKKTNEYLLLFQEWWGVNDYVKKEADMWCKELGINVMAIDLYDGKVAKTPDMAGKYMQENDPKRSSAIILGAARYAGPNANFRTLGWCFGGGWSLQASLLLKEKSKACVMYYGMPEQDVEKLKMLQAPVMMIHANLDKWITAEVVSTFENNMKAAGKQLEVHHYNAGHAFANPSAGSYNSADAKASRELVKAFLKKSL